MFKVDVTTLRTEIALKLNQIKELEYDVLNGDRDASESIMYLQYDIHAAETELRELV